MIAFTAIISIPHMTGGTTSVPTGMPVETPKSSTYTIQENPYGTTVEGQREPLACCAQD